MSEVRHCSCPNTVHEKTCVLSPLYMRPIKMTAEEKVLFAVSSREIDDGATFDVLLGVPLAAWEYMKDGHTHTFDLTKLGLPFRILLYGGPDHAAVRAVIDVHNAKQGLITDDQTDRDFSV